MSNKAILIVHPYDKTTIFLKKIVTQLESTFGTRITYLHVETNDESKNSTLDIIQNYPIGGTVLFLGHGRSDALIGSKGDWFSPSVHIEDIRMAPDKYYYDESFISKANISVLTGKRVFCLSCNSNDTIGRLAIENHVETFLGFGSIPSSLEEFNVDGYYCVSQDIVDIFRNKLCYVVYRSLEYSLSNDVSFEKLLNLMKFIISQEISDLMVNGRDLTYQPILVQCLYMLKKELIIFGNGDAALVHR